MTRRSFLFVTLEAGGVVTPTLTSVEALARRGHRVRVISDPCNKAEVEAAGADFIPWTRGPRRTGRRREDELFADWAAPSPQAGFDEFLQRVLVGPALEQAQDVAEALRGEPADLVVCSEMLFGPQVACEGLGQPYVLLSVQISLFPVTGAPPLGPGLAPARTPAERALHAEIAEATHAMLDAHLPTLNGARAAFGLRPLSRLTDQMKSARRLLLGASRAFDFAPERLPANVAYVGPQLRQPGWAAPWRSPFEADDPRPLVLVGFSTTFQNHVGVLQRVIDALAGLPVRAVLTTGDAVDPAELRAPASVAVVATAPHDELMAQAVLVVTHGGHGTVMRALTNKRPMLILPHGRDQDDNAVRVTTRGAGLSLPPAAGVDEIRQAVRRLLEDPRFREAAARLGAAVAREARQSPLLGILESLAAERQHEPVL